MNILDVHTHILPGIDDGAATPEESLEMLKNAIASDVTGLVATPHFNIPNHFVATKEQILEGFRNLQQLARDLPITLFPGAEVHITRELPQILQKGEFLTLNNSRYLLSEFPAMADASYIRKYLSRILAEGCIPLVAHPERYPVVCQEPSIVESWLDMGCHIQLTAGSVLGKYGITVQAAAAFLLNHDLVACVASDAHGTHHRTNYLGDIRTFLETHYSPQYARFLLWENPKAILQDQNL